MEPASISSPPAAFSSFSPHQMICKTSCKTPIQFIDEQVAMVEDSCNIGIGGRAGEGRGGEVVPLRRGSGQRWILLGPVLKMCYGGKKCAGKRASVLYSLILITYSTKHHKIDPQAYTLLLLYTHSAFLGFERL